MDLSISIHAPREGGDSSGIAYRVHVPISIHAPREGGDLNPFHTGNPQNDFNPRPPRGGRRDGDRQLLAVCHFNPRPPRGGRLFPDIRPIEVGLFQSTPPARGATAPSVRSPTAFCISIHAPREGGDDRVATFGIADIRFQSTPPARGATNSFSHDPKGF